MGSAKGNPYGERRTNTKEVREDLLRTFFDRDKAVLVGPVSMYLKCSLAEAEAVLETMREDGLIRLLTQRELRDLGLTHGYHRVV